MPCKTLILVFLLVTCTSLVLAVPAMQVQPGASLSLQECFDKGFTPAVGPAPVMALAEAVEFDKDDTHSYARVRGKDGKASETVVAAWKAGEVLSTVQGAISFWVKATLQDEKTKAFPLLRMVNTQAGTWSLSIKLTNYQAAEKKMEEIGPKDGSEMGDFNVDDGDKPLTSLFCNVGMKIFNEGTLEGSVGGRLDLQQKGGWHHVIWTWRSIHSTIYIDGKVCGSGDTVSRLQPIANPDARLELLQANVDLADLRIYRRALEADDAEALVAATPAQYLPAQPLFRLWADWAMSTGRTVVYADTAGLAATRVELSCVENAAKTTLKKMTISSFPSGLAEVMVPVTAPEHFPAGAYHFEGVAFDKNGKEIARARSADWTAEKPDWPWLGSRAGLDKTIKILPPYTPIQVKGNVVSTVLRDHTLDRNGLFKSIVAGGGELLAAPVALDVESGGHSLAFTGGPGVKGVENKEDSASWSAETATADGHTLQVNGYMEYDGVTRFDVTLTPKGTLKTDRLELRIPYTPDIMRLVNCEHSGYWRYLQVEKDAKTSEYKCNAVNWAVGAPKDPKRRPGVIFDSNDLDDVKVDRYKYAPYMHVGDYHRGLAWFIDNDRNWVYDAGKAPSMELVVTEKEKYLRLNILAKPTDLTEPLQIRFYLLANPLKPLPKDWRTWVIANNGMTNDVERHSAHRFWWHWSEYADSFKPYPGLGEPGKPLDPNAPHETGKHALANNLRYEDWAGKFKGDKLRHIPFINFGTPGGCPAWSQETMVQPYTWKLHNNRATQDYMLYWLERCVQDIGISGVYVDEPYVETYSYNILAGDAAYVRADGTRGLGYRFMEARDYIRRLKQMFSEHGIDYSVWIHSTNYKALPVLTFADISMDGEHPQIWVTEFDNYHAFYNPAMSRGYLASPQFGFVGSQMYHSFTDPKKPNTFAQLYGKTRSYLAVTLPYGVLPQTATFSRELDRTQDIRYAFGIFDDGIEDLNLGDEAQWLPGASFAPEGLKVSGNLNTAKNRALLYTSAPWAQTGRFELAGGFAGLKLGKPFAHAWNAENGVSLQVEQKTIFDTLPNDFGMILVQGMDQPQHARPDGAILGVSFDKGIDADFGGDMAPPAVTPATSPRKTLPGKAGSAFPLTVENGAVAYSVVPSWVSGTVEFDLQLKENPMQPLKLVSLQHQLDVTLACVFRNGAPALHLTANEITPADDLSYLNGNPDGKPRQLLAPLPAGGLDGWNRVTLVWRSGQYELYWNAERLGTLSAPAAPRLRSPQAMAAGVIVGDSGPQEARGQVAIDNLLVYDWALRADDIAAGKGRKPMTAAVRPAGADTFPVWVWGNEGKNFIFGANLSGYKDRFTVSSVKFTLLDKNNPKTVLGGAEIVPWQGVAIVKNVPSADIVQAGEGDPLNPGGEELADLKDYTLRVELYRDKAVIATRTIELKGGKEEPSGEY